MLEEKIIACLNEIRETVEDVTDEIFILFYIFDKCKKLSKGDKLGLHCIAKKIKIDVKCTSSESLFVSTRNAYYATMGAHISPRQSQAMKKILDKHLH